MSLWEFNVGEHAYSRGNCLHCVLWNSVATCIDMCPLACKEHQYDGEGEGVQERRLDGNVEGGVGWEVGRRDSGLVVGVFGRK